VTEAWLSPRSGVHDLHAALAGALEALGGNQPGRVLAVQLHRGSLAPAEADVHPAAAEVLHHAVGIPARRRARVDPQGVEVRQHAGDGLDAAPVPRQRAGEVAERVHPVGRVRRPDGVVGLLVRRAGGDVRHQAAMSLATVCNQNDISDLAEIFNDETQRTDSRILAASILSVLGDFRGYDFILQIANSGENNYHRGLAITALGNFNRPETVDVLRNVAKYGNKALRIRAAEALGEIGTPEAISVIQILLDDSNQAVHESAQNALQKIEHKAN